MPLRGMVMFHILAGVRVLQACLPKLSRWTVYFTVFKFYVKRETKHTEL